MRQIRVLVCLILVNINFGLGHGVLGQSIRFSTHQGLYMVKYISHAGCEYIIPKNLPLFSIDFNGETYTSAHASTSYVNNDMRLNFSNGVKAILQVDPGFEPGWKADLKIKNTTPDTLEVSNMVPFNLQDNQISITSTGPWSLTRAKLFRQGKMPVSVIIPDNAWELGYGSFSVNDTLSLSAMARRTDYSVSASAYRYVTILPPSTSVTYSIYADCFIGAWQKGLILMFQERCLYDLEEFDPSLYEREDLAWIRDQYLIVLQFAWDREFYDYMDQAYGFVSFLEEGEKLLGGYDVYGLWPTWPTLGLDQRNQWDLYQDLPGGLEKLRALSLYAQSKGTSFFIAYNPWDQSTRKEDPYQGMARLIQILDANGVILDCRGNSSYVLQHAADSVKEGVIMYSEGMAAPKDMPGIVAGRVHNAIVMPPILNLNKLIKPDFAIFRVCQPNLGSIHREVALSFFNGYGNELNLFAPQRIPGMKNDYPFLGRVTMLLRENSQAFHSSRLTPLISTNHDSIWVNEFLGESKSIYTVYSMIPEGFNDVLFQQPLKDSCHYVSIYRHEELIPDTLDDGNLLIPAEIQSFNQRWLNTKKEGKIDCIACFENILEVELNKGMLHCEACRGSYIRVWAGHPSYRNKFIDYFSLSQIIDLYKTFGRYEGKFVVQLFDKQEIIDERMVYIKPGTPRLISTVSPTQPATRTPRGMVKIPGGAYDFSAQTAHAFIPYPDLNTPRRLNVHSFFIDQYPVTNKQFNHFIKKSGYFPEDTNNYLKHWKQGQFDEQWADYPVVNISYADAKAYAKWAGKRLPTEIEWQYAAQSNTGWRWPWGDEMDSTKCNYNVGALTRVDAYPAGESPFGVMDLVGNIWQMTHDVYDNGSYYFLILKGGGYYEPTSSWWYVQGGPKPVNENQKMLLVSPGFNRNATVGFRCVKDVYDK